MAAFIHHVTSVITSERIALSKPKITGMRNVGQVIRILCSLYPSRVVIA